MTDKKIISLAEYETQTRTLQDGRRKQSVSVPLKSFQPVVNAKSPENIMRGMHPYDIMQCQQIAFRARDLALQLRASMGRKPDEVLEMNPAITGIDFAVVWYFREGYDFAAMLKSDNLTFLAEFTIIQQNIKRDPPFFSRDVRLRFARNGARFNPV